MRGDVMRMDMRGDVRCQRDRRHIKGRSIWRMETSPERACARKLDAHPRQTFKTEGQPPINKRWMHGILHQPLPTCVPLSHYALIIECGPK